MTDKKLIQPFAPAPKKKIISPGRSLIGVFASGMGDPHTGIIYGPELIDDGTFTTGLPWNFDAPIQWSVAGGVAHYNNTASGSFWETCLGSGIYGSLYRLRFTISGAPGNKEITFTRPGGGGIFNLYVGFVVLPNGSYDQIVRCVDTFVAIRIWAAMTGLSYDLDNLSLRKVTYIENE